MEVRRESTMNLFHLMKNSKVLQKKDLSSDKIYSMIHGNDPEYSKISTQLSLLQSEVTKPKRLINKITSFLEFSLASGNNDRDIMGTFFISKLFLEFINAYNISLPEYREQLLNFFDKILYSKQIAKYLSKNQNLLPKILTFLNQSKPFEISIKISEVLLMNTQSLYPMQFMFKTINAIFHQMQMKDNLDVFCRILAILIFDYKKIGVKQCFKSKETLRIKPLTKITIENQSICLHFNKFFKKLVHKLSMGFDKIKRLSVETASISHFLDPNLDQSQDYFRLSSFHGTHNRNANEEYISADRPGIQTKLQNNFFLSQSELSSVIHLNVFESFIPFGVKKKDYPNIFNNYMQLIKLITEMKNKFKIKSARKQYITMYKFTTYQIEMLFVLSTFLGSKRKVEIQDKLGKLNLIEILGTYLEYMEWGNIFGDNKRPYFNSPVNTQDDSAYHGEGCACDSDSALKLQYLRLIYTFCNRDSNNVHNKLKMFSKFDIETFLSRGYYDLIAIHLRDKYELYKNHPQVKFNSLFFKLIEKFDLKNSKKVYDNSYESIEKILLNLISFDNIKKNIELYNENENKIGLLQKILYKYIQECYYSSAKFWLSSCIEVLLRGNNTLYQTYIGCNGLMPCLLYDILYSKKEKSQITQLSFDILGELIKFNRGNFFILNHYLSDKKEFSEFFKIVFMKDTLVDSNVFIRAIIISNHIFKQIDRKNGVPDKNNFVSKCQVCTQIQNNLHSIFNSLICIVKPNKVHQTNISCINTALVILIVEYLNDNLEDFLSEVRMKYKDDAIEGFENFKILLSMWKEYYNYRPKDSSSLEHSSTIPFSTWFKVANIVLSNDTNDKKSLNYSFSITNYE